MHKTNVKVFDNQMKVVTAIMFNALCSGEMLLHTTTNSILIKKSSLSQGIKGSYVSYLIHGGSDKIALLAVSQSKKIC